MATVVFITGVGRGIGRALAEAYLARPNHTVIGSVRNKDDAKYQHLRSLPAASGSKLILVSIESASKSDPHKAVDEIKAAGVDHVDIVIANAGTCPPLAPLDVANPKDVEEGFQINTLGPILLYQAVKPLLDKSSAPRWVSVSSAVGSIGKLEAYGVAGIGAYGVAKAGLNWFTVSIHAGNPSLIAFAVHPGLVQSDMGNSSAKLLGLEKAPVTLEQCSSKLLSTIDQATREKTSGKFLNIIDDEEIPW
ncbi:NAD(P)-binding protein [Parathielavia appendiculata]|uniref:NAD(P)-binding protein n=1 Tax=Parathielavia appendiculata TaxID=2587402 RepID=A0AAN6Z063_9PEZI|nr:NAD(P)-binding protein [Parathielavia appendiculata]